MLAKFQLPKFGVRVCTESKTSRVLGLKSDAAVQLLHFAFSFAFLAFAFLFFFFAGHFLGIILVGKVFGKAFRIVGLDEESFFLRNFRVYVTFFVTFSGHLDWIYIRFEKSLPPAQLPKLDDKVVLDPLNWRRHKRYEERGYGRFRGDWVNTHEVTD